MESCWPQCSSRRQFVTVLALGLTGLLVTFHLVHLDRASLVPNNAGAQGGSVAARLWTSFAQFAQQHRNGTLIRVLVNSSKTDKNTSLSPAIATSPRAIVPEPRTARFPAGNNSTALEVTVSPMGQLGNHIFQYASLLGIAHMNSRRPFIGANMQLHGIFEVTHVRERSAVGFERVEEKDYASYDPTFEHLPNRNVIIGQYLQSWKYFDTIRDTVKQEFRFRQHLKDQAARLLLKHQPRIGQNVKVGVHVRRGDMALAYNKRRGYKTAPASYLNKAMDYMRRKHSDVIFVVVTHAPDTTWCRNALKSRSDYVIADSASAEVHLALLASCDHVIMTVGTYGWWGGYLSGGDVVYYWDPKESLHHPPLPVEIKHPEDFFPPTWISLPG